MVHASCAFLNCPLFITRKMVSLVFRTVIGYNWAVMVKGKKRWSRTS